MRIHPGTIDSTLARDNEQARARPYLRCPLLAGVLVEAQTFTGGTALAVRHGLGRPALGVVVVWSDSNVALPITAASTNAPNHDVMVTFAGNCVASLWVF